MGSGIVKRGILGQTHRLAMVLRRRGLGEVDSLHIDYVDLGRFRRWLDIDSLASFIVVGALDT